MSDGTGDRKSEADVFNNAVPQPAPTENRTVTRRPPLAPSSPLRIGVTNADSLQPDDHPNRIFHFSQHDTTFFVDAVGILVVHIPTRERHLLDSIWSYFSAKVEQLCTGQWETTSWARAQWEPQKQRPDEYVQTYRKLIATTIDQQLKYAQARTRALAKLSAEDRQVLGI